jgi:hypothetical protein
MSVVVVVVVAFAAACGGFALHATLVKVAEWDAKLALMHALPRIQKRFSTDQGYQRACFAYSNAAMSHQCELAAMDAALQAYENVNVGERHGED